MRIKKQSESQAWVVSYRSMPEYLQEKAISKCPTSAPALQRLEKEISHANPTPYQFFDWVSQCLPVLWPASNNHARRSRVSLHYGGSVSQRRHDWLGGTSSWKPCSAPMQELRLTGGRRSAQPRPRSCWRLSSGLWRSSNTPACLAYSPSSPSPAPLYDCPFFFVPHTSYFSSYTKVWHTFMLIIIAH